MLALGERFHKGQGVGATCVGSHGPDADRTSLGPDLTDDEWLWGDGSPASIVPGAGISAPAAVLPGPFLQNLHSPGTNTLSLLPIVFRPYRLGACLRPSRAETPADQVSGLQVRRLP